MGIRNQDEEDGQSMLLSAVTYKEGAQESYVRSYTLIIGETYSTNYSKLQAQQQLIPYLQDHEYD